MIGSAISNGTSVLSAEERITAFAAAMKWPEPIPIGRGLFAAVVRMTPVAAQYILEHHHAMNRNRRPSAVEMYASDILAKRFVLNQPVLFNENLEMYDGQHRLHAIVKADVPLDLLVILGFGVESMPMTDIGAKRSPTDAARISGGHLPATRAGTIRVVVRGPNSTIKMSPAAVLAADSILADSLDFINRQFPRPIPKITKVGVLGAVGRAWYHCQESGEEDRLSRFCEILANDGVRSHEDEAAATVLWKRLLKDGGQRAGGASQSEIYYATEAALMRFLMEDESAKPLKLHQDTWGDPIVLFPLTRELMHSLGAAGILWESTEPDH